MNWKDKALNAGGKLPNIFCTEIYVIIIYYMLKISKKIFIYSFRENMLYIFRLLKNENIYVV